MERFLYFRAEATTANDDATGDSAIFPASSLIAMEPTTDSALTMYFSVDGVASSVILNLTTANTHLTASKAITHSISTGKSFTNKRYLPALIIIANDTTGATEYLEGSGIASCGAIVYGSTSSIIKILPGHFLNEIGSASSGTFTPDSTAGWRITGTTGTAEEVWAFVEIPSGMKATSVTMYDDDDDRVLKVYEMNINSEPTGTLKGTGACNTALNITNVNSTATNYLGINITTTGTTDRIWGGSVAIESI